MPCRATNKILLKSSLSSFFQFLRVFSSYHRLSIFTIRSNCGATKAISPISKSQNQSHSRHSGGISLYRISFALVRKFRWLLGSGENRAYCWVGLVVIWGMKPASSWIHCPEYCGPFRDSAFKTSNSARPLCRWVHFRGRRLITDTLLVEGGGHRDKGGGAVTMCCFGKYLSFRFLLSCSAWKWHRNMLCTKRLCVALLPGSMH